MSEPRELLLRVRQWVQSAENDLRTAEHMLTLEGDCPFDVVCFHAQQCAEKYIKAFLVYQSVDFPKTHDLVILLRLAAQAAPLAIRLEDLQPLNRYAIEARYPGDWEPISRAEAEKALAIAERVRMEIRGHLAKTL
jgi:HEPN domain-containing protein